MGKIVRIVIMVAAAWGMFHGLQKQKAGVRWGKPMAIACALLALLVALSHTASQRGPSIKNIVNREMAYQRVSARKLGMHLAQKYANSNAIIIVQPSVTGGDADRENALVEGLKEEMEDAINIVGEVSPDIPAAAKQAFAMEMPPEGEEGGEAGAEMLPPLEYWFTAELFDKLVKRHCKQADLIITTIGLPQDLKKMKFWMMKNRPKLAVAGGSVYELKKPIKAKAVVAAITYSPQAVYEDKPPPDDLEEAFKKRFLMVTPENIDQIASQYPDLFMKDEE